MYLSTVWIVTVNAPNFDIGSAEIIFFLEIL